MQITLVARELDPAAPDGEPAEAAAALANALCADARACVVVGGRWERESVLDPRVEVVRAPEPTGDPGFQTAEQEWSASAWAALRELHPDGGPDVLEFLDARGAAFTALQAAEALDPWFANTTLAVRLHGTRRLLDPYDGLLRGDLEGRFGYEVEEFCLRRADVLLAPAAAVAHDLGRLHGPLGRVEVLPPPAWDGGPRSVPAAASMREGALRLLYLAPLSRCGGAADLVEALLSLDRDDWTLTLAGWETMTAPRGRSVDAQIEAMAPADDRIARVGAFPADRRDLLVQHDLLVAPARWAAWPQALLAAAQMGRPVLATPVGGLPEMLGGGGRLAAGTGWRALADALEHLLDTREALRPPAPPSVAIAGAYAALRRRAPREPARPRQTGRVSVVIPSFQMPDGLERAVASVDAQTHADIELVVVDDGSGPALDPVLDRLERRASTIVVRQPNRGTAAARNLGLTLATGDQVVLLDADDLLLPGFVERCAGVLAARPDLGWVQTWVECIGEGAPLPEGHPRIVRALGGWPELLAERNTVGMPIACLSRRLIDAGWAFLEGLAVVDDWALWLQLREAGVECAVIPEVLARYAVRPDSALRRVDAWEAVESDLRSELAAARFEGRPRLGARADELRRAAAARGSAATPAPRGVAAVSQPVHSPGLEVGHPDTRGADGG